MSLTDAANDAGSRAVDLAPFGDWDALSARLAGLVERARLVAPDAAVTSSFAPIEDAPPSAPGRLGRCGDVRFRGLVGAAFVADLACYAAPDDQVSFDRLLDAMRTYPRGFRVWGAPIEGAGWLPLGYSAVIPIAEATFARIERGEATLAGAPIAALGAIDPGGGFLYLFNYSVVPALRRTPMAKRVIEALAIDVAATPHRGLAALTVSDDGARVARRFGMAPHGGRAGAHETAFTCRWA